MIPIDTEGMQVNHLASYVEFKPEPALSAAITRIGELARECGDKDREISKLKHEIACLKNVHAKPYRGCRLLQTEHEGAPIALEYEYQPAEPGSWDEPSYPASVEVIRVWIGGHPFSYELFEPAQLEAWGETCMEAEHE